MNLVTEQRIIGEYRRESSCAETARQQLRHGEQTVLRWDRSDEPRDDADETGGTEPVAIQ